MRIRRIALGLFLVLALVAAGAVYAVSRSNAALISEAELLKLARGYANSLGMVDEPYEEQSVMTTLGTALTLQGIGMSSESLTRSGKTRESPTFLYQVRGDIPALKLSPEYGRLEYLVLELDPATGNLQGVIPILQGQAPYNFSRLPRDIGGPAYPTPNYTPMMPHEITDQPDND